MDLDKFSKIDKEKAKQVEKQVVHTEKRGRRVNCKVLKYDINENDSDLQVFIKEMINSSNITNIDVYNTFGRPEGWNMIYGLNKGISWERANEWAKVTNSKLVVSFVKLDEEE